MCKAEANKEEEEEDKPRVVKRKRLEPKQGSDVLKVDEGIFPKFFPNFFLFTPQANS
jgi:hypothetical protein